MIPVLSPSDLAHALSLRDLTDRQLGVHSMQCLLEDVEIALRNVWRCGIQRHASRRVLPGEDGPRTLLDAGVEAVFASAPAGAGDVLHLLPGLVFRRTTEGALVASQELLVCRVRRGRRLSTESSDAMVHTVMTTLLPERAIHTTDRQDPLLCEAVNVSVDAGDQAAGAPVACAGIVRASVIETAGRDSERVTAIAMSLDLDRVLMLRKGIPDVRLLRSEEPHVRRQLLELGRFRSA